ncbi:AraC family transcriptional regulator [Dulcicalothrix desertica PCC 7102]|uniref:AraC family transcriptional regulator n=1 Tax=Dulcicalothrix desertica PCC 7102 TaxID=232991 RepID=A0A3S1CSW8_9CYAN|nr:AraC family transcriptional regulator [Dulcicalothrix desertica]RUT09884.1 AraC family transcriptional regulator [Dulcicalothrix desertica PCC 7102]TWH51068.1 AraC family transcriptional regulator [Dulcicalothrix desertica PCC 7102]
MMSKSPLMVDFTTKDGDSMIYPRAALLSSYASNWDIHFRYHSQPQYEMPEHSSNQNCIIMHHCTLQSPIIETIEGVSQASRINWGKITVLPANVRNKAFWETEYEFITLAFEPNIFIQYITEAIDVDNVELLPTLSHPDPLIHGIALALKSELESNQLGGRVYVDSLVTALMAHLLRNYSVKNPTQSFCKNALPKRKLQQVLDYIHAHLDQDLTLFKLAAIVYMSPSYFSTLFKQSTGLAPHQYIIRYRVERAKQLLLEGKLSIAEISTLVGFTHQSHLSYHFRRRFGSSPKVFISSQ